MLEWRRRAAVAAFGVAAGLAPQTAGGQDIEMLVALPAATLTFSAPFIAEDAGFYKKEGLKVTHRTVVGVGSVNAVIAGSADFTMGTGPVFLRAAAQGQRLLALANLIDKPLVELVLRKDVAAAAGINAGMPLAERAKALKGKTIAIQGVGSIVHAWERLVASRGGLDVEKDVRIAPMDPPGMLAALDTRQVNGYATSLPFTTEAVVKDKAVMLASAVGDAPDLLPFAYGLVYTRPDMCVKQREKCARITRALAAANRLIAEQPAEALAILRKRFERMDQAVLEAAWQVVSQAHARDIRVTRAGSRPFAEGEPRGQAARAQGRAQELRRAAHRRVRSLSAADSPDVPRHDRKPALHIPGPRDPAGQGLAAAQRRRAGGHCGRVRARNGWRRSMRWPICRCVPCSTEHVVPYETDEVTRLVVDTHDAAAFAPISHLTVGGLRDWLLSDVPTRGDAHRRWRPASLRKWRPR